MTVIIKYTYALHSYFCALLFLSLVSHPYRCFLCFLTSLSEPVHSVYDMVFHFLFAYELSYLLRSSDIKANISFIGLFLKRISQAY